MDNELVAASAMQMQTKVKTEPPVEPTKLTHVRMLKAVFPGKYIQGEKALHQLSDITRLLGRTPLLIASPTVKAKVLPLYHQQAFEQWMHIEEFQGECSDKELERLAEIVQLRHIDVIIGMGGGKTVDTAKIISDQAGIPVIIVPTIASTDAPCSGCAIIYTDQGVFQSVYYQKMNPQAVLVDTSIIAAAPVRYLVAGIGDALSTWFEARSCERTQSMNECGGYSTMAGLNLAKLCYDTILQFGQSAKIANENNIITPALNHVIEANILLSGIGFESSGLAAAHAIHNGLTALDETHHYFHGEKVAFGVLTGLHLTDASPDEMETVYAFCEKLGLPTTLQNIGIEHVSKEKLMPVAVKACAPVESIHKEAGRMTPERVLHALLAADAMGRERAKE